MLIQVQVQVQIYVFMYVCMYKTNICYTSLYTVFNPPSLCYNPYINLCVDAGTDADVDTDTDTDTTDADADALGAQTDTHADTSADTGTFTNTHTIHTNTDSSIGSDKKIVIVGAGPAGLFAALAMVQV
jgi:hypothetical protein